MNAKTLKEDLQLFKMPVKAKSSRGETKEKSEEEGKGERGIGRGGVKGIILLQVNK